MSVQTQIYAKPRHQFMPSWVPRNTHGHHGHRGHHHNNSHGYHGNRDHHGAGGKMLGGLHGGNAALAASALPAEFDGKRLRKAVARKTVDYNASLSDWILSRVWQRDHRDAPAPQPDPSYQLRLPPPAGLLDSPVNVVTTKFVRAATNKMKCPVFCVTWTPEGRRLITGASSGEFTLWNGLTFNFETILQAHDLPVRCMTWSRGDQWMVTGDHGGYIKYWQSNMNNVRMFQGHKEAVRGIRYLHPHSSQKSSTYNMLCRAVIMAPFIILIFCRLFMLLASSFERLAHLLTMVISIVQMVSSSLAEQYS